MGQSTPSASRATAAAGRCPICSNLRSPDFRPFCSQRCADVDLSRWLRGAYAIPGGQEDADEDGDDAHDSRRPLAPDPDDA